MNSLLIVAPNWLGDAVMALPAIADVRRAAPGASIAVAARGSIRGLFSLVGVESHFYNSSGFGRYTENGIGSRFSNASVFGRKVKTTPDPVFDAALLLPNSFHSALAVWRAGIAERWGYRTDWRGRLLTRAIERPARGLHQVDYYQRLVLALGFPNGPAEPRIELSGEVRAAGADALARAGWDGKAPVVALAPGAAYGGAKRWPPEYFARLAQALADDGIATAMIGSGADASTGREIESHLHADRRHLTLNLIGATDLSALAGALAACRALVTNDSGAMHLAAALGVRVTAVFGPTNEHATGPRGPVGNGVCRADGGRPLSHAVLTNPVWCRPCMLRECPIDHRCMRGVPVDLVLAEARRTL